MTLSSVSTLSLANTLVAPIQNIQAALSRDEVEASTGQYANLGLQLGAQSGYELSLRNQNDFLQTLTTANSVIATNLSTTQVALDSMTKSAQSVVQALASFVPGAAAGVSLQSLGTNALQQLVATVNTTSNGQYVLGGQNTGVAPLASPDMTGILTAFQAYFGMSPTDPGAASISLSQLQDFLSPPPSGSGAFTNQVSSSFSASSVNATAQIAPGQSVTVTTSANQPAIQDLAQGYAMLAAFGQSSLSQAAQQQLASTATSLITQGVSNIGSLQASIGLVQKQISDANSLMASQQTLLQTQIGNLDNVDAAKVATDLSTLSTQLQTAYQLTAQLQKLSLAQYL